MSSTASVRSGSRKSVRRSSEHERHDPEEDTDSANESGSEHDPTTNHEEDAEKGRQPCDDGEYKDPEGDNKDRTPRRRKGELLARRRRATYKRIPLVSTPLAGENEPWLPEGAIATEWLGLFYSLSVSSSLSAVNSSSMLQTPAGLPNYFGYYSVLIAMWMTQLHYDLRYQANDMLHRILKAGQILLFMYLASASGGWDLSVITPPRFLSQPDELDSSLAIEHDMASQSFLVVSIVAAAHCGVLALQYCVVFILGHKVKRPTKSIRWSFGSLAIACAFFIAAATVPATDTKHAHAKIALLYLGVFVQFVTLMILAFVGGSVPPREGALSTQYGSLSISILGQGVTNITGAFQSALTGIGQSSSVMYSQIFLCLGVFYFIWAFLFANFNKKLDIDAGRTFIWEVLHFFLHFTLLILIAAMVNAVTITSWSPAIVDAYNLFYKALMSIVVASPLSQTDTHKLGFYLERLDLSPDFLNEYTILEGIGKAGRNGTGDTTTGDQVLVAGYQYVGQILKAACSQSSISVSGKASKLLLQLSLMGQDGTPITNATAHEAARLASESTVLILEDIYSGMLWILPAAGFVLILCALRSVERFKFNGAAGYVIHGFQFVGGGALAFLGLLDLGGRDVRFRSTGIDGLHGLKFDNPMYRLVSASMSIALIFIVYVCVQVGYMLFMEGLWMFSDKEKKRRGES